MGGKIFIIDDDKEQRQKYKKFFKENKFEVLEASAAIDVVDILMREKENIGIIILDLQLPEIEGQDIYDIIHDYAPRIPVIVSSVLPVNDQKLKIPRARDYYQKSDRKQNLLGKVNTILS